MNLPVLSQRPQTKYKQRNLKTPKNDILVKTANHIVEFFQDVSNPPSDINSLRTWFSNIFYKENRILYLGIVIVILSFLLIVVSN
jgi:hypothetical protein